MHEICQVIRDQGFPGLRLGIPDCPVFVFDTQDADRVHGTAAVGTGLVALCGEGDERIGQRFSRVAAAMGKYLAVCQHVAVGKAEQRGIPLHGAAAESLQMGTERAQVVAVQCLPQLHGTVKNFCFRFLTVPGKVISILQVPQQG